MNNSKQQSSLSSMNPTEFEVHCKEILNGYAEEENLKDFKIIHNKLIETDGGRYQIDIYAEAVLLKTKIKILCECKKYSSPVKRDVVMLLDQKLRATGAQKGILLSTNGFQKGAIEYAKRHGIALIRVYDNNEEFYSYDGPKDANIEEDELFNYMRSNIPLVLAECYFPDRDEPTRIYPTQEMVKQMYKKIAELTKKEYNIDIKVFED